MPRTYGCMAPCHKSHNTLAAAKCGSISAALRTLGLIVAFFLSVVRHTLLSRFTSTWTKCLRKKERLSLLRLPGEIAAG